MKLSDRIKAERNKRNMSQDALANELHVSRQAISKWETGQSYPDLEKLIQLSDIFGITLDELVKGDKNLEKKLISEERFYKNRLSVWGCVLIAAGVLTGFWGGSMYPADLMNDVFLVFLIGAFILITMGCLLIKDISKRIILGSAYLTLLLTVWYMIRINIEIWVLLIGIVVIAGFGWWFTLKIIEKTWKRT